MCLAHHREYYQWHQYLIQVLQVVGLVSIKELHVHTECQQVLGLQGEKKDTKPMALNIHQLHLQFMNKAKDPYHPHPLPEVS